MTLAELNNILKGITGFEDKVVYYSWPVNKAPELPFICYLEQGSNNFVADGVVYSKVRRIDVELYTETKDPTSESLVESALTAAGIVWQKTEDYIDTEKVFMITYEIEV